MNDVDSTIEKQVRVSETGKLQVFRQMVPEFCKDNNTFFFNDLDYLTFRTKDSTVLHNVGGY
jgi:hypothetical protein